MRFVAPEEGCPYVRFDLTMLKGAPHPNAARLLMNFYLSDEAQEIFARGGYTTVNGKPMPEVAGLEAPARNRSVLRAPMGRTRCSAWGAKHR